MAGKVRAGKLGAYSQSSSGSSAIAMMAKVAVSRVPAVRLSSVTLAGCVAGLIGVPAGTARAQEVDATAVEGADTSDAAGNAEIIVTGSLTARRHERHSRPLSPVAHSDFSPPGKHRPPTE